MADNFLGSAPEVEAEIDKIYADRGISPLEQSYLDSAKGDAAQAAKIIGVANKTGQPDDFVSNNLPVSEMNARRPTSQYFADIMQRYPNSSSLLMDRRVMAASHDDIDNIAKHEEQLQKYSMLEGYYRALNFGLSSFNMSLASVPQFLGIPVGKDAVKYWQDQMKISETEEAKKSPVELVGKAKFSELPNALIHNVLANAPNLGMSIATAYASGGSATIIQNSYLAFMGLQSAAAKYQRSTEAGVKQPNALVNAYLTGSYEALSEKISINAITKWSRALAESFGKDTARQIVKNVAKAFAANFSQEAVEEAGNQALSSMTDTMMGIAPWRGYDAFFKDVADAAIYGGAAGFVAGGPASLTIGLQSAKSRRIQSEIIAESSRQAQMTKDFYEALGQTAEASKVRQRLSAEYRAFVEKATKNGPVSDVYVTRKAMEALLQESRIDVSETMEKLGAVDSYLMSLENGEPIKIPIAQMTQLIDMGLYQKLSADIKLGNGPNDKTFNEAEQEKQEYLAQAGVEAEAAVKELEPELKESADLEAGFQLALQHFTEARSAIPKPEGMTSAEYKQLVKRDATLAAAMAVRTAQRERIPVAESLKREPRVAAGRTEELRRPSAPGIEPAAERPAAGPAPLKGEPRILSEQGELSAHPRSLASYPDSIRANVRNVNTLFGASPSTVKIVEEVRKMLAAKTAEGMTQEQAMDAVAQDQLGIHKPVLEWIDKAMQGAEAGRKMVYRSLSRFIQRMALLTGKDPDPKWIDAINKLGESLDLGGQTVMLQKTGPEILKTTYDVSKDVSKSVKKISPVIPQSRGAGKIPSPVKSDILVVRSVEQWMRDTIASNPEIFPIIAGSSIRPNVDYGPTFTPTNNCPKGLAFTIRMLLLRDFLDDAFRGKVSPEELAAIKTAAARKLLAVGVALGIETPCLQCYTTEKQLIGYSAKPLSLGQKLYHPGDIEAHLKDIRENGGILRAYGTGDFTASDIASLIALGIDLGEQGMTIGFYSKSLNILEIFGDVGFKFNISVGMHPHIGLPIDLVRPYIRRYRNATMVGIAINDEQLEKMGIDKDIGVMIPTHLGPGTPVEFLSRITGMNWQSFTRDQTETIEVEGRRVIIFKPQADKIKNIDKARELLHEASRSRDAETYLAAVEKASKMIGQEITPKFPQFVKKKWYHKLIGTGPGEYGKKSDLPKIDMTRINLDAARRYFLMAGEDKTAVDNKYATIARTITRAAEKGGVAAINGLSDQVLYQGSVPAVQQLPQEKRTVDPFYHKLQRDIKERLPVKATVEQVRALLREQKAEEVAESGIETFLKDPVMAKDGKIDREELLGYLEANQLEVEETMLVSEADTVERFFVYSEQSGAPYPDSNSHFATEKEAEAEIRRLVKEDPELKEHLYIEPEQMAIGEVETRDLQYMIMDLEQQIDDAGFARTGNYVSLRDEKGAPTGKDVSVLRPKEGGETIAHEDLPANIRFIVEERDAAEVRLQQRSAEGMAHVIENDDGSFSAVDEGGANPETFDTEAAAEAEVARRNARSAGGVKFSDYQLPGGKRYRELLLRLPQRAKGAMSIDEWYKVQRDIREEKKPVTQLPETFAELDKVSQDAFRKQYDYYLGFIVIGQSFTASHWDQPNVFAHVRFNERLGPSGEKILFIEEIQSDWHQKGRKLGYKSPTATKEIEAARVVAEASARKFNDMKATIVESAQDLWKRKSGSKGIDISWDDLSDVQRQVWIDEVIDGNAEFSKAQEESRIDLVALDEIAQKNEQGQLPDAPFKKTWHEFALKRMIRWAAENGFDTIAWTTGEQQAVRYDLSKQVDSISYHKNDDGTFNYEILRSNQIVASGQNVSAAKMEDTVGKEMVRKMEAAEGIDPKVEVDKLEEKIAQLTKETETKYPSRLKWIEADKKGWRAAVGGGFVFISEEEESAERPGRNFLVIYPYDSSQRWVSSLAAAKAVARELVPIDDFIPDEARQQINHYEQMLGAAKKDLERGMRTLAGLDLKVGGEGMKGFYDKMLVDAANKLGKRGEAKVESIDLQRSSAPAGRKYNDIKEGEFVVVGPSTIAGETGTSLIADFKTLNEAFALASKLGEGYKVVEGPMTWQQAIGMDTVQVHSLPITKKLRDIALQEGFSMFQAGMGEGDVVRGAFYPDQNLLKLFETHNQTTFIHEMAHSWLLRSLGFVASGQADEAFKKDWLVLAAELDIKPDQVTLTRPQQEKFARLVEAYMMRGEAPSVGLRGAFSRVKRWFTQIYKGLPGLEAQAGIVLNLSPEVKAVMDRIFASEEEIAAATQDIGYQPEEIPGLAPEMADDVRKLQLKAREMAESELLKEAMKTQLEMRTASLQEEEKKATEEATKIVSEMPIVMAMDDLQKNLGKGKVPAEWARLFKEQQISEAQQTKFLVVAEVFGLPGEEFADTVIASKTKKDMIDEMVKARMDAFETPDRAQMRDQALEAIHSEQTAELLALERVILGDLLHKREVSKEATIRRRADAALEASAIKTQAQAMIARMTLRDASAFRVFYTAERRAAMRVSRALAKKDLLAAEKAKREQLVNHALAAESIRTRAEISKYNRALQKLVARQDFMGMPYGFIRQIDKLLSDRGMMQPRIEDEVTMLAIAKDMALKGETPEAIANMTGLVANAQGQFEPETLAGLVARINDNYHAIDLPDTVYVTNPKKIDTMSVEEFRNLTDTVKLLADIGKRHERFLTAFIKADMKTAAKELRESIENLVGTPYADDRKLGSKYDSKLAETVEKISRIPDSAIPLMVNLLTIAKFLDGGLDDGPAHRTLYRILKDAENDKIVRQEKMMEEVNAIFARHYTPKELLEYKEKKHSFQFLLNEDGSRRYLSTEEILTLLLNWGNEGNRSRIMAGFGSTIAGEFVPLSEDNIQTMLDVLRQKDFEFAQDIWNHLQSYWPDIVKLEMIVNGSKPDSVEASPVTSKWGTYRGGYYPIAYDFDKSAQASKNEDERNALYKKFSTAAAHTQHGHTEMRMASVKRPVRLSLDVLFNHLENVVHDLAYRPAVIDMNAFLKQSDVRLAVENAIGINGLRAIEEHLKSVASDQGDHNGFWDSKIKSFRMSFTMAVLGARLLRFIPDVSVNLSIAMWELGPGRLRTALLDFARSPVQGKTFVDEKSSQMRNRAKLIDRDISDIRRKWDGRQSAIAAYAFCVQAAADQLLTYPMWLEVYNHNLALKGERVAIQMADEAVIRTFGSGSEIDRVGVQRGGEKQKLMSMFYSWNSMMFNRMWIEGKLAGLEYKAENTGAAIAHMAKFTVYGILLPALIETTLLEALRNAKGDDREARRKRMLSRILQQPFGYVWLLRDIASYGINRALGVRGSYRMSPLESAVESLINPVADAANIAFTNKKADQKFAENVSRAASAVLGIPMLASDVFFNMVDWHYGNSELTWKDFISRERKK